MKKLRTFVFSILLGLAATTAVPHSAKAEVSVGFFYDNLSPYGDWVSTDDYGYCWRPSNVSDDWRPYQDGYWAYTDDGWTWVSYEDYGGIVYHYGRWVDLDDEGWVWVPGTQWAPAWVSWRSNDDYVGWAPLPPEAHFSATVGFGFGVDAQFDIGPSYYNFCPVGHFGDPDLRTVIVNKQENTTIINNTTNITNINITKVNKTVYNGGPSFATISQRTAHPIQRLNLVRQSDVRAGKNFNSQVKGNSLIVAAPQVTRSGNARPAKVAKQLGKAKADRGWSGVTDPAQRQAIETKFKTDAKRPKNQPINNAAIQTPQTLEQTNPNAAAAAVTGEGKGKKHKGDTNLQPFMGGGAAQQPEVSQPTPQAQIDEKKGKKHKDNADFGGAATPSQPDLQNFNSDQPKKSKKNKHNQDDAQAQELKQQRQADQAAQAQAQQEKAARRQAQAEQAQQQQQEKAARHQAQQEQANQADQAAKAERKQEQRAMQQQMMQQQAAQGQGQGGGGKGEGKKKKKDKNQDQPDNN
ncbi:MAG: hypothetical protein QM796_22910 [Chthoniobacteraceae bacterium]